MYSFHKKDCFNRAQDLVDKGDDASLRYACLELRQCIESVAYNKLKMYEKFVPEIEFERWQPKRVFDFLEEIEPLSTKDYKASIFKETPDGSLGKHIFSGVHDTLKPAHLKKEYNKLGSYLHTPTLLQQKDYTERSEKLKNYLTKLLSEMTPIVESSFDSNIDVVVNFQCGSCEEIIYHRKHSLEVGKSVKCPRSECGMLYEVNELREKNVVFKPVQAEIPCSCGNTIYMNYLRLKDPSHVRCECGKIFDIKQEWVFGERT